MTIRSGGVGRHHGEFGNDMIGAPSWTMVDIGLGICSMFNVLGTPKIIDSVEMRRGRTLAHGGDCYDTMCEDCVKDSDP